MYVKVYYLFHYDNSILEVEEYIRIKIHFKGATSSLEKFCNDEERNFIFYGKTRTVN